MARRILALYASILRAARPLPGPVYRKVAANARHIFDLHRATPPGPRLQQLEEDGAAAVRVLAWLGGLQQVWTE